jgi:transposase
VLQQTSSFFNFLQNLLKNLETAYKNFFADFKKIQGKKGVGFPKFKKRHGCKQSISSRAANAFRIAAMAANKTHKF